MDKVTSQNPNRSIPELNNLFNPNDSTDAVTQGVFESKLWNLHILPPLLTLTIIITACALILHTWRSKWIVEAALRCLRHGGPIPSHIAFIMDGNRRWARKSGLQGHEGHPRGGNKLLDILQWCLQAGVKTVTVYAFSIENFKRPAVEVEELMRLTLCKLRELQESKHVIHANGVRVRVWGDLSLLSGTLRAEMGRVMRDTMQYKDGPTLNICFAYTARHDIASAVWKVSQLCGEGRLGSGNVCEKVLGEFLCSGYGKGGDRNGLYPELLVRTSGETRLSDFLLWEGRESVLSFYPRLWPEMDAWDLIRIIFEYQMRGRVRGKGTNLRERSDGGGGDETVVREVVEESRQEYYEEIARY